MRYFTGFLIILCSVIFWLLPVDTAVYAFKTEPRTDDFLVTTAIGVTSGNSTLIKSIYDNDVSTLLFSSNCTTDAITYTSYNTTTRLLVYGGLTADTTRLVEITYDASAFDQPAAFETICDIIVWWLFIFFVVFPMGGLYVAFKPDIEKLITE